MDPLADPMAGDVSPLVNKLSTVKAVIESARAFRREKAPVVRGGPVAQQPLVPGNMVLVRNDTGGDLPTFSVLTPSEYVIDPDAEPFEARRKPVVAGVPPVAETDPVLVTFEPIPDGEIGRAVADGVAVVAVEVLDDTHQFANPIPGDTEKLQSAETGSIRILVPSAGTTDRKHYVLLNGGNGGGDAPEPEPTEQGGYGWVAGLTEDDCLWLSVLGAAGRCAEIDTDQGLLLLWDEVSELWVSDGDFNYDAVTSTSDSGPVEFTVTADGVPKLTIADVVGVIDGSGRDEDGYTYIDFKFGGLVLCGAEPSGCDNTFKVRLACSSCAIRPGYNPGPYPGTNWDAIMAGNVYSSANGYLGKKGTPLKVMSAADLAKCDVFVYFVDLNHSAGTSAGRNWSGASIDVDDLKDWIVAGGRCILVPYYNMFTGGGGTCGGTFSYVNGILQCGDKITADGRITSELNALSSVMTASLTELTFPTTTFGCGAYWSEPGPGLVSVPPCGYESVPTAAVVATGAGNVYDQNSYNPGLAGGRFRSHFFNGTAVTLFPATYYGCPYTGPVTQNLAPIMIEAIGAGYLMAVNYWTFRKNPNGPPCNEFFPIARNFRDLANPM